MRPYLLYRNRDFRPEWGMLRNSPSPARWRDRDRDKLWAALPQYQRSVTGDLELDTVFDVMARGDPFLLEVARNVVLSSEADVDTILYRQGVLNDCIRNPKVVRELYAISDELIEGYLKEFGWYSGKSVDSARSTSIRALEMFVPRLTSLRTMAETRAGTFESEGFRAFFALLMRELSPDYLARVQETIRELSFPRGIFATVELGEGNKGTKFTLQRALQIQRQGWVPRVFSRGQPSRYSFTIADRDTAGYQALAALKGRSTSAVAQILLQASDHLYGFFVSLKTELAFYLGCLNLRDRLTGIGEPVCFPEPCGPDERALSGTGLYDACMALRTGRCVVGNEVNADGRNLVIITGANRGGKSTFLRSLGLAHLLMQCGCFAPAASFRSSVSSGIFTHFKREEDRTMKSGKFDEELGRMSDIVDHLRPGGLVLFNESFAATNERDGSEISRQIVSALVEREIRVVFVTHLNEYARGLYDKGLENALFLRAERKPGGERTFRMIEGEPLQTSFGQDLYTRIFCETTEGGIPPSLPTHSPDGEKGLCPSSVGCSKDGNGGR